MFLFCIPSANVALGLNDTYSAYIYMRMLLFAYIFGFVNKSYHWQNYVVIKAYFLLYFAM